MTLATRLAPALVALLLSSPPPRPGAPDAPSGFTAVEPGLDLGTFPGPPGAPGDGRIWIVRVDPAQFDLRLLNASASDARPRTLRDWATGAGAVAAINAGMFQADGLTGLGLMRTRAHQNNPRRAGKLKSVLAFDPVVPGQPPLRLIDLACGEGETVALYGTQVQSIRMISCDRQNVWAPDDRAWSTAALGIDGAGRALFIHARSPWPVHELASALLALPIDLRRAMYLEGGPEAQLWMKAGGRVVERRGAFEGGAADERSGMPWELPNVLVAVRRGRPPRG